MKRIISLMLTLAVALSLLVVPAGAASTPEEALGEVNIYDGGYSMKYLAVNGKVQTQSYTYFLYETRRMEYTIYNAAMDCPELWKDGVPTLNLHLGISAQNAVQMFWPWQEDQLTQVFCSAPGARFEVEAWDVYHDGKYLYTEYNIRGT